MVVAGLLIGATSGLVHVLVNAGALPVPVALVLRVLAAVVYAGLVVVVVRRKRPSPGPGGGGVRFSRGCWAVAGGEVALYRLATLFVGGTGVAAQGVFTTLVLGAGAEPPPSTPPRRPGPICSRSGSGWPGCAGSTATCGPRSSCTR